MNIIFPFLLPLYCTYAKIRQCGRNAGVLLYSSEHRRSKGLSRVILSQKVVFIILAGAMEGPPPLEAGASEKSQCLFSTLQAESQVVTVLFRMLDQIRGTNDSSHGYRRGSVREEAQFTLYKGDGEKWQRLVEGIDSQQRAALGIKTRSCDASLTKTPGNEIINMSQSSSSGFRDPPPPPSD